jgi:hypothetical protein
MRWLVTYPKATGRDAVLQQLRAMNCEVGEAASFTPLGPSEEAVEVEGPRDLPELAAERRSVVKVYPSSTMEPFGAEA